MRNIMFAFLSILVMVFLACEEDSTVSPTPTPTSTPVTLSADNQSIISMVAAISSDSLHSYVERLSGFQTRHSNSDTVSAEIGIGAARNWIFRKFQTVSAASGGRLEVAFDDFVENICDITGPHRNVVARLPGTGTPELQILVSGHYDSRTLGRCDETGFAPGANDDGSGTAAVIELARVLSQYEFESTLVFVAFTGEEQGLLGSRHYASHARQRGDNIIAMVTNDVIGNILGGSGNTDATRVRCFSDDPTQSPHRQLARYIKLQGEAYVSDFLVDMIPARDRPNRGGDHFAFNEQGYTAARLTEPEDNLDHQHDGNDLIEFMSFDYLRKVVQVNGAYLASLAGAPPTPTGLAVENPQTGQYNLSWNASSDFGSDIIYLIAMRSTNSTTYDSLLDVGANTEVDLSNISSSAYISVAAKDGEQDESLFSNEILIGQ
jgi:hypothetical protein